MTQSKILIGLLVLILILIALGAGLYEVDRKVRELKSEHLAQVRIERKRTLNSLESLESLLTNPTKHQSISLDGLGLKVVETVKALDPSLEQISQKFPSQRGELPFPRYFVQDNQPVSFHPFQGAVNIIALMDDKTEDSLNLALKVLEKTRAHRTEAICPSNGKTMLLFNYPFDFLLDGKVKYSAGWVSAFTQGFWLVALSKLHEATKDKTYLELSRNVLNSLKCFRSSQSNENNWVTFIDENDYVWFEEYPKDRDYTTRVLNGHIWVIRALYHWKLKFPDDREADVLFRAGIATIERYGHRYRNPGGPNLYDLTLLLNDYSFGRTLDDQEWLFQITGNPYFQKLRDWFKSDSGFQ